MYHEPNDMPSILQSDVPPGASGVIASPDAAEAFADVSAHRVLSFAGVKDLFIGRGDGHGSDGAAEIFIRDVLPVMSAICCFPDTSAGSPKIKGVPLFHTAGDSGTAATPPGSDQTVGNTGKQDGISVDAGRFFLNTRLGIQARAKLTQEGKKYEYTHAMKLRQGMKSDRYASMLSGQKKSPATAGGLYATRISFSLGLRVRTKSGPIMRGYALGNAFNASGEHHFTEMMTPIFCLFELCCVAAKRLFNGLDMVQIIFSFMLMI
jgi:hypothetical protein